MGIMLPPLSPIVRLLMVIALSAFAVADLQGLSSEPLSSTNPGAIVTLATLPPRADVAGVEAEGPAFPGQNPAMFPEIAEPPPTPMPDSVESDVEATTAFGPDTVPFEVFNSSDPKYVSRLFMPSNARRNRTNICSTGSFAALDQSLLNNAVYPYANIGQFVHSMDGSNFQRCTAMQVAADVILTAAHCVFHCPSRKWLIKGTYYDRTYGSAPTVFSSFKRATAWTQCDGDGIPLYDFALVRLYNTIPKNSYPFMAFATVDAVRFADQAFSISYPAKSKPGNIPYFAFKSPFDARFPIASRVEVSLSTEVGSSGAPLFMQNLPTSGTVRFPWVNAILGVTSYEYVGTGAGCPNGFSAFQGPLNGYNANTLLNYV